MTSLVEQRVAELGLSQSIVPFVLKELHSMQESKAVGSAKGKLDPSKQAAIQTAQRGTRFVSSVRAHARQARKQLDAVVSSFEKSVISEIKRYHSKKIEYPKLKTRTTLMLKGASEQAFQLGVKSAGIVTPTGSLYKLTSHEKKWLDSYLKEEVGHWNKFLDAVRKGQSDRKTLQRVKRYAEAIRSVFESGRVLSVGPDVIIHWVLESGNPCPDCKTLHRYSPYTADSLPTTPKAGQTRCLSNCYCTLRIVKSSPKEVDRVRKRVKKASWIIKKINQARKKRQ